MRPDCRPLDGNCPQEALALARNDLSVFWKAWFGELFGRSGSERTALAFAALREGHPQAAEVFTQGVADLALALVRTVRTDAAYLLGNPDFWRQVPPALRPLSGYIHMYVQNRYAGRESLLHAVSLVERLQALW